MSRLIGLAMLVAVLVAFASAANAGATLDAVRARGHLVCGVAGDQPGLSLMDARGAVTGFEADICRAVAAALFGSPQRIEFRKLAAISEFLRSSDVDLVVHGLTVTFARESALPVRFGPVTFHDGQALLTKRPAVRLDDLAGRSVCARSGGAFIGNLQRAFVARGLALDVHAFASRPEAEGAWLAGKCVALSADATELAGLLIAHPDQAADATILPERLSKEPLAPLMRRGDEEFLDVVRWAVFALIEAEERGITGTTAVDIAEASERLGLPPGWTRAVVGAVGNYGEIYDRHFGAIHMARGANALARDGGLMTAPPLR